MNLFAVRLLQEQRRSLGRRRAPQVDCFEMGHGKRLKKTDLHRLLFLEFAVFIPLFLQNPCSIKLFVILTVNLKNFNKFLSQCQARISGRQIYPTKVAGVVLTNYQPIT